MSKSDRRIKGLGEVSILVQNLDDMQKFYEEVIGLEVLRREEEYVFFKIAEGYGGHSQNLALFAATLTDKSPALNSQQSSLHHIALNIALEDFDNEKNRLESLGIKIYATVHEWLHVRSMYFPDPEGNQLELVCYDETL